MRSIGTRGVTVVSIVTFIFAPVFHHGKRTKLERVGRSVQVVRVHCHKGKPCPHKRVVVRRLTLRTPVRPGTKCVLRRRGKRSKVVCTAPRRHHRAPKHHRHST